MLALIIVIRDMILEIFLQVFIQSGEEKTTKKYKTNIYFFSHTFLNFYNH